ncbi:LuxR C-terminal-related transcriptional regulator [Streptomyces sp. DSM 41524]|uniref:LuxR C-terminal-related transcriptional regulator n=1 Tax=Streptomyces asiaticus subsp. ignotus TaxID=3098222 RepID=A0ABU7Q710_9ACTN|nr:LuxR C-terminal-related transcriptional regulator [Streptomyces sp. DSM 41524]
MTPFAKEKATLVYTFSPGPDESGLLLIRGPKCSGKTTVLNTVSDSAAGSGALTLWATCWLSEHDVPLGVLFQILDQLDESDEGATHPAENFRTGGRGADGQRPTTIDHEQVYRRLLDVAARRPVLIAVDDINHVDLPSRDFLRYLARRLRGTRIRLVLAERTGLTALHNEFRTDVVRLPYTWMINLRLLSRERLATWLGQQVTTACDPVGRAAVQQTARRVYDLTGGNVFLAKVLLDKYLASVGRGGNELTVDADFYDAVRVMVTSEDSDVPGISHGARAAAVLGHFCSPQRLARLLDGDSATADRVLRTLEELGMTSGTHLRGQIGRALIDDRSFTERTDVHLKAARILFEDGVAVSYVAQHLQDAGTLHEPWNRTLILELVSRALEDGHTDVARVVLGLARDCAADLGPAVAMLLLRSVWLEDSRLAASLVPPLVAAAQRGALDTADMALLVRAATLHGFPDHAWDVMSMLHERPPELKAQGEVILAKVLFKLWQGLPFQGPTVEFPAARSLSEQYDCLAMFQHSWLPTILYKIPGLLEVGDRAGVIFAAEQILAGIRVRTSGVEPFLAACRVLDTVNASSVARKWCVRLSEGLDDVPSATWKAVVCVVQAKSALALGDLGDAYRMLEKALVHKPWQEWGAKTGALAGLLLELLTEMGKHEEAEKVLDRPIPSAAFQGLGGMLYRRACGRHHLAIGRLHAAVADFESCRDASLTLNVELPMVVPWRCDLAEAYLETGDVHGARDLLHTQLSLLPEGKSAVHGMTLRLLARTSKSDKRVSMLKTSADELEHCGNRLQLAHTLADLAFAYRETSRLNLARTTMRRAQRVAEQCEAGRLQRLITVDTIAGRHEAAVENRTELDKLSSAERRVALLAIQGRTNREISESLFITPSTVEQHLTRIYKKLEVRHREELENLFSSVLVSVDAFG